MKKLALLTVGVAIVLVGFMAILYCLPCNQSCHGGRDRCEMKDGDGKCGHDESCKDGDEKCSGHEGCKDGDSKCSGGHEGCEMGNGKCPMEQGGCKMDGKENGGCNMQMGNGGSSCNMQGGNHGCCCCCMMMSGCQMGDSAKSDTAHVKVRGKL